MSVRSHRPVISPGWRVHRPARTAAVHGPPTVPHILCSRGPSMPALVLVGAQWGDEGKGKATDLLGSRLDYVVRYNGGNNAGHTIVIGTEKYALHLLPTGILTPGCVPVIGNGVVIDLSVLFSEIDLLEAR